MTKFTRASPAYLLVPNHPLFSSTEPRPRKSLVTGVMSPLVMATKPTLPKLRFGSGSLPLHILAPGVRHQESLVVCFPAQLVEAELPALGITDTVHPVGVVLVLPANKPLGGSGHDLSAEEPHRRAQNYNAER
jgi:hypothetical protein